MRTCEWLATKNDALLAVAGAEKIIQIISIARCSVVKLLQGVICSWNKLLKLLGHTTSVSSLRRHPTKANILLSSANDGVRVWDLDAEKCIVCIRDEALDAVC